MNSWFQGQMDYLFFCYGLVFFCLGVVCYLLSRIPAQRFPWTWLALFGFTHGLSKWMNLMGLIWPGDLWLTACHWGLIAVSFLFLLEFTRLNLRRQQGRGPMLWFLALTALILCLGALAGASSLHASTIYALGLVGGLGAGWTLVSGSKHLAPPSRPWLLAGGVGFWLYGLGTGLMLRERFVLPEALNDEILAHLIGLPLPFWHGILVSWIVAAMVGYFLASWPAPDARTQKSRIRYLSGTTASLIIILIAGWFFTQHLGYVAQEQVYKDLVAKNKLIIQRLILELQEAEAAVKAMSGSPWLAPALTLKSPRSIAQANSVLDRYQLRFGASPAFLMDHTGMTVASSNRAAPDSFVAHNYQFRPYFKQALAGQPGRYFAVGVVSKKRGFYASYPVQDQGQNVLGVAVIKLTLDQFQWVLQESDPAFLVDPEGLIFLGSRPELDFHSLWPVQLTDPERLQIQYGIHDFPPVFPQALTDRARVTLNGNHYLFHQQPVDSPATQGWSLVLLAPAKLLVIYRLMGIATTFTVVVLVLLSIGSNLSIKEGANRILASESQLKASLSLSKATLESTADGILVVNLQGQIVSSNQKFRDQWRLSEEVIASKNDDQALAYVLDQLTHPQEFLQKVKELYAQPAAESCDILYFKDGRVFERYSTPQYLDDAIVGRVWSFRDVTSRIQAQEALRDSEQFLTDVFNCIQDGLRVFDSEFKVIRANPAMDKFPGAQSLNSNQCHLSFPDQNSGCESCPVAETFLTGEACHRIITQHLSGRSDRFVEIHAFPLHDRTSNRLRGVIEYVRDVTELKKAEIERSRLDKMESLAILAGGIAHDFNNILTAILGNIGLAALDNTMGSQGKERLAQAEKACLRAQTLSQQLLTFSAGGAPIKKILTVPELLKESANLILSGSNTLCEFSIPENLWSVEGDEGQLSQAFGNLLLNADQAMPDGGVINLSLANVLVAENSQLPLPAGNYLKIAISDQGIGISPNHLDKIFDPYFSTKQKGSGLGLTSAYSIIKNHSGHLAVDSQMGAGTTFTVYLPATEAVAQTKEPECEPIRGHGRILLMDDEAMVREVVGRMLNCLGYQMESASEGSQAVEKFAAARERGQSFDAVILDLTIPGGKGGKDTIKELLAIDPQIKAIVSSGYSDDRIMADFQKYGFCAVIPKPYRIADLGEILHRVLGQNSA